MRLVRPLAITNGNNYTEKKKKNYIEENNIKINLKRYKYKLGYKITSS